MKYLVDCGTQGRPQYDTLKEACAVANEICKATGIIVGVFEKAQYEKMRKEETEWTR